jgi:hypothetical protein
MALLLAWGTACVCTAGQAQEGAPAADSLDPVRNLVAFVEENTKTINDWLDSKIEALKVGAAADQTQTQADEAGKAFRSAVLAEHGHEGNSREFPAHFSERYFAKAAAALSASEQLPRRIAWPIARVMLDLVEANARPSIAMPALEAALQHADPSVRLMAVIAFSKLKTAISADANLTRSVLQKLQQFGQQPQNMTSGVLTRAVYDAMSYTSGDQLTESASAIEGLMSARAKARRDGELMSSDRGDIAALEFIETARNRLSESARVAFVRVLAAMLAWEVEVFAAPDTTPEQKAVNLETIASIEQLLINLTGIPSDKAGNIRGVMASGATAPIKEMEIELIKWVGKDPVTGVLNAEPWNIPLGGY